MLPSQLLIIMLRLAPIGLLAFGAFLGFAFLVRDQTPMYSATTTLQYTREGSPEPQTPDQIHAKLIEHLQDHHRASILVNALWAYFSSPGLTDREHVFKQAMVSALGSAQGVLQSLVQETRYVARDRHTPSMGLQALDFSYSLRVYSSVQDIPETFAPAVIAAFNQWHSWIRREEDQVLDLHLAKSLQGIDEQGRTFERALAKAQAQTTLRRAEILSALKGLMDTHELQLPTSILRLTKPGLASPEAYRHALELGLKQARRLAASSDGRSALDEALLELETQARAIFISETHVQEELTRQLYTPLHALAAGTADALKAPGRLLFPSIQPNPDPPEWQVRSLTTANPSFDIAVSAFCAWVLWLTLALGIAVRTLARHAPFGVGPANSASGPLTLASKPGG